MMLVRTLYVKMLVLYEPWQCLNGSDFSSDWQRRTHCHLVVLEIIFTNRRTEVGTLILDSQEQGRIHGWGLLSELCLGFSTRWLKRATYAPLSA